MTASDSRAATGIGAFWPQTLVHAAALGLIAWMASDYLRGDASDPARSLILRSGTAGLLLLVAALACTPVATLTGWRRALLARRTLGLYGFAGITVHLSAYATFDGWLDPALIWRDLGERRSMFVGLLSFLALIPLAATSTHGWQRRLGRRWKLLHRLVYLAAPLAVMHYLWLDRDIFALPLLYAAIVALLLALRLPQVRQLIVRYRQRLIERAPPSGRRRG